MIELSVIIPCYQEEKNIPHIFETVLSQIEPKIKSYEFIFIDDGSKDHTWNEIQKLASAHPSVKGIRFSRNFGKEYATAAGVSESKGSAVLLIDADLQHPPHLIPQMIHCWAEEKYDVVECVKRHRGTEAFSSKIFAQLYYKLMSTGTGLDLINSSDFKLLDRKVVDAWIQCKEWNLFFRGLVEWLGFRKKQISFEVAPRLYGKSGWSFLALTHLAISTITSFSSLPLYFLLFFGFFTFFGSLIASVLVIISKVIGYSTEGFPTVILLQFVFSGTILFSIGFLGIYISKIYEEVKGRPRYIILDRIH
jgi:glycosyltransferase involved in cell wall biosynthesis